MLQADGQRSPRRREIKADQMYLRPSPSRFATTTLPMNEVRSYASTGMKKLESDDSLCTMFVHISQSRIRTAPRITPLSGNHLLYWIQVSSSDSDLTEVSTFSAKISVRGVFAVLLTTNCCMTNHALLHLVSVLQRSGTICRSIQDIDYLLPARRSQMAFAIIDFF